MAEGEQQVQEGTIFKQAASGEGEGAKPNEGDGGVKPEGEKEGEQVKEGGS